MDMAMVSFFYHFSFCFLSLLAGPTLDVAPCGWFGAVAINNMVYILPSSASQILAVAANQLSITLDW